MLLQREGSHERGFSTPLIPSKILQFLKSGDNFGIQSEKVAIILEYGHNSLFLQKTGLYD